MERITTRLRRRMAEPGLIVVPYCFDPLTARIAARLGFECVGVGGYVLGAALATSEPLMTMTELVEHSARIARSVDVPLKVDAGAGYGDPLHVMRTVRELEAAGVAAVHIEDQVFPKRALYHRDYQEHTIPAEEMATKIRYACQARRDKDFVIIARTDAMQTHGYAEGVRRANLYAEAGADAVMLFPNNADEARRAPKDCHVPLNYVISWGNRVGRPVYTTAELEDMGYKLATDAVSTVLASYRAVHDALTSLKQTGSTNLGAEQAVAARKAIEDTIGLEEYYRVEEETVER